MFYINKINFQKKVKEEIEEKDEFDEMANDQKSLTEKLGNSPDLINKKLKAAKKGNMITTVISY